MKIVSIVTLPARKISKIILKEERHKLSLTIILILKNYWKNASTLPELIEKRTSTSIPINVQVITKINAKRENKMTHLKHLKKLSRL